MNTFLFRSFLVHLVLCGALAVTGLWWSLVMQPPEVLPRLMGTTFVLGLGSALALLARILRDFHRKYTSAAY